MPKIAPVKLEKLVALTFGDGPNPPYTDQILEILKKNKIPGTFFVCGANIVKYPGIVNMLAKEGHIVGNHSYYHNQQTTLLGTNFDEILKTQELINKFAPNQPKIFRSPFGAAPPWLMWRLIKEGFAVAPAHQSVWGHDFKPNITTEKIISNIISGLQMQTVTLLHDGNGIQSGDRSKTVASLKVLIPELKNGGYRFVDLPDLMQHKHFRKYLYP